MNLKLKKLINPTYSDNPELLAEVIVKTEELLNAMERLRKHYEDLESLPLKKGNSDYYNMRWIAEIVKTKTLEF